MNAHTERHLTRILASKPYLPTLLIAAAVLVGVQAHAFAQEKTPQKNSANDDARPTAAGELTTETIDLTNLRRRLATECGLLDAAADDWIHNHVTTLASREPDAILVEGNTTSPKPKLILDADKAVVTATDSQITRIQESLQRIEETGVAQIVMRLSVYQGTAAAMEQLDIRWAHVETSTSIATSKQNQNSPSDVAQAAFSSSQQSGGVTLAGMMLNKTRPTTLENVLSTRLNKALVPSHDSKEPRWIEARSIIELGTPVLYTMMAPEEIETVVQHAGASKEITAVSSTLVAIYNGNPTQINNVIERPFVTAVKPRRIVTDGESRLLFEPRTKVYPEGFRFIVRPTLVDGSQIRLTCSAEQFSIQNVRTMDIPVAGETERTIRVQMPTAAKSSVRAQLDIPKNFALALSTESLDKDGQPMTTLFVCQCGSKQLRDPAQGKGPK